jgi:hypothetical protein
MSKQSKQTTVEIALTRETLEKRRKSLVEERDAYIQQANQQIATFNGAILLLDELLGDGQGEAEPPHIE